MTTPKKLIEVALPLEAINIAMRPSTAAEAVIFSQMADSTFSNTVYPPLNNRHRDTFVKAHATACSDLTELPIGIKKSANDSPRRSYESF